MARMRLVRYKVHCDLHRKYQVMLVILSDISNLVKVASKSRCLLGDMDMKRLDQFISVHLPRKLL